MPQVFNGALGCILLMTLAACLPEEPDEMSKKPTGKPDGIVQCTPEVFDHLIGQPGSAAAIIPDPKRIIPDGTAVTMDHIPNRTNVELDQGGLIARITCG